MPKTSDEILALATDFLLHESRFPLSYAVRVSRLEARDGSRVWTVRCGDMLVSRDLEMDLRPAREERERFTYSSLEDAFAVGESAVAWVQWANAEARERRDHLRMEPKDWYRDVIDKVASGPSV